MSIAHIRPLLTAALLVLATRASAQSGIRLVLWHFEGVTDNDITAMYGLGFDRDLNDRVSLACEVIGTPDASVITMRYRSAFHFTEIDDGGSGYFGPMVALSAIDLNTGSGVLFPLGARLGFRGTLPGVYMDIYGGYQVQAGAGALNKTPEGVRYGTDIAPFSYMFGIDFGFGVSRGRKRD